MAALKTMYYNCICFFNNVLKCLLETMTISAPGAPVPRPHAAKSDHKVSVLTKNEPALAWLGLNRISTAPDARSASQQEKTKETAAAFVFVFSCYVIRLGPTAQQAADKAV